MKALSEENGGEVGDETNIAKGGYNIAALSAGGAIAAVSWWVFFRFEKARRVSFIATTLSATPPPGQGGFLHAEGSVIPSRG